MKKIKLTIEDILKTFESHAEEFSKGNDMSHDPFNLPEALYVMCKEIISIKEDVESISDEMIGYDR